MCANQAKKYPISRSRIIELFLGRSKVCKILGDNKRAFDEANKAYRIAQGDDRFTAEVLMQFSDIYAALSEYRKMREMAGEASALYRKLGDALGESDALEDIGLS